MENNNNIELRSEEVREILGSPPGWIIRSSISIILLVILALLAGSYFYRYPDLITGRVTIVSESPPIPVVARSSGKLEKLLVADGQTVGQGEVIGIIENPADFENIRTLKLLLDSFGIFFDKPVKFTDLKLSDEFVLGQNQSLYSAFVGQLTEYQNLIRFDYLGQQVGSLSKQVVDYEKYLAQLKEQSSVLENDLTLSEKQLNRDSVLYAKGVMSEMQYEQSQGAFFKQEYNFKNSVSNLSNTQIRINQLGQQILEIKTQRNEQEKRLLSVLKERYDNLIAQLAIWEQSFVLKAPINGDVTFTDLWSENQYVQSGNTVFTVVPGTQQKIIGKLVMPVAGSGKVEVGQEVNVKLDNFPYMEYGLLESTITSISMVPVLTPEGGYYTAELELKDRLVTNYKKELGFIQEMQGTAEIITKDRRLIERLVEPLIFIFKKNVE